MKRSPRHVFIVLIPIEAREGETQRLQEMVADINAAAEACAQVVGSEEAA